MNKAAIVEALQLFIEKTNRLKDSNFVKNAIAGSGVNFKAAVGQVTTVTRSGPDQENIDAFVLTFRYFIQDNETISLRNIRDIFHSSYAVAEEKRKFDRARQQLNTFLDGNTMFDIGGKITRRKLMDSFIYGGLSHAKKDKKKQYDSWMGSSILAPFMENEFIVILFETLNIIVFIQNLCDKMLRRINT